nr:hypothetical protein [Dyella sp. ASV24]
MVASGRVLVASRMAVIALALGSVSLAHAQSAPAPVAAAPTQVAPPSLPQADKQQIKQYKLTDDVFGRLSAATREARASGIPPQMAPDAAKVHSLDDLANQAMAADPRIPVLVKKYGFTPREFMLANIALMNAIMAVQARADPSLSGNLNQTWVNADNIRFVQAHQAEVQALLSGQ